MIKFKRLREMNGQTGKLIKVRYRPQNASNKLPSHSTIEKSDLYKDIQKNTWKITVNTNSLEIRVPSPKGREKDRETWLDLVANATKPSGLIRGGGLTPSECKELLNDMKVAAKAFKADSMLAQSHSIYVSAVKTMQVEKGLAAMLKAIEEFGMRNHVSVSGKEGVLTQIQDAGQYNFNESVNEAMKMKDIARKHKRELQNAVKKGSLELSKKAEEDLMKWAMDNGEVNTDDPDDFIEWLDNNLDDIVKGKIKEDVNEDGPCWDGYKQVGTKMKNGKEVPNCVPIDEAKYTNIHNKIKGIRNLSRKEADMIADIDPAVLGPVVKALAPMFEEVTEDLSEARMPMYKPTKFDGKEFDKKKEIKNIKNMIKALHKVAKMQDDFQYTAETGYTKGGNPNDIYNSLVECEQALYSYYHGVERGQWDGTIDMDRD
jgi:hypothetical protein